MAGHSIFGIYTNRQGVEAAVQALRDANFRSSDISVLAPENLGDIRDIGTVKSTKAPEGATAGGPPEQWSAECSAGWWALERWRSRASGHFSPPVLSWLRWPESASAPQLGESPARW